MTMENQDNQNILKKREKNFSDFERNILIEICRKHSCIENKSYNNTNLMLKKRAWNEIQREFAATTGGVARTIENLQGCWKRIKMEAKKVLDERRIYARRTGGGPPLSPLKAMYTNVLSVLGDDTGPLENQFDPPSPIEILSCELGDASKTNESDGGDKENSFEEILNSTAILKRNELTPASLSKKRKRGFENENDVSFVPRAKMKSKSSLKELQIETMEIALKNEKEKSKLIEQEKLLIEMKIKNEEELLLYHNYKLLLAKAQYDSYKKIMNKKIT